LLDLVRGGRFCDRRGPERGEKSARRAAFHAGKKLPPLDWRHFLAIVSVARGAAAAVSALLHPELIHAGERLGPLRLEGVPSVEIAHEVVATENAAILLQNPRRKFESNEPQIVLDEKRLDLRDRHSAFLDVKQQVATLAGAEEIARPGDAFQRRFQQVLSPA